MVSAFKIISTLVRLWSGMMWKSILCLAAVAVVGTAQQVIKARVVLADPLCKSDVHGYLTFTQVVGSKGVDVKGEAKGMPQGEYGYAVHTFGDLSQGCSSIGDHYNPDMKSHGHRHDEERHVGDLGNMVFNANKVAQIDFHDDLLTLTGNRSIIGRAVALHSMADDYGKTEHPDSKVTGNAGVEVACGVIGVVAV